jgi:arylsulfatase A-like enzyme
MPFPRAKTTLYDSGIRVPFLVKWPARIPKGGVSNALASAVDIAPTILEIAGVAIPEDIQGASMQPALLDANNPGRTYVFAERNWHNFDDHAKAVRWKNLKYHRNFFPGEPYYPASDISDSPSYQAMLRLLDMGRLTTQQTIQFLAIRPEEALYNLDKDPYEFQNLVYDPQYQADLAHLRQVMDQWLVDTHDTDPGERHYDNIINRTGERLYPGRGIPRRPVDFEQLKKAQDEEEARLLNP